MTAELRAAEVEDYGGWVGLAPSDWPVGPLRRFCDITLGKMVPSDAASEEGTSPYLRAAHVQPGGVLALVDVKEMTFTPTERVRLSLNRDDVVVVEGGAGYGRSAVLLEDMTGWGFQNSINRVRAREGDGRFLDYQLRAARASGYFETLINTATIPHLTAEKLAEVQVAWPSLELQRQIADYLDAQAAKIDALIGKQERLIATLTERRRVVISQAVTRGLNPNVPTRKSGVKWLGDVPNTWALRPLWSMFKRVKDVGHPDETMLSVFREHGVVIKDDHANLNQTAENRNIYQLIDDGWLVANRMKAWQGSVGISKHRGIVSGHYICFQPRHHESSAFLNYLFRSTAYAAGYSTLSRGVRIGQAEIDNDQYRVMPVLVPPAEVQAQIVEHLGRETSRIDALSAKAREMIEVLKERRQALISAAVTGKIDVRGLA